MPTRIDGELFQAAKAAGRIHSRSAAQQLAHWARIGRELEASPAVTHGAVEKVLTGQLSYDAADGHAQALVRAQWDENIDAAIAKLDFTGKLSTAGRPWPEANENGDVVWRDHDAAR